MHSLKSLADPGYCVLRLMVGLMFACHGAQKLLGMFGGPVELGDPEAVVADIVEIGAGILIAIGLFTRVAAFFASGEMAVAYFKAHAIRAFFPIQNHGELAALYCWVFLFVLFYGPGRWSIDALIKRRSRANADTSL